MGHRQQHNRRTGRSNVHEVAVLANADGTLRTVCSCGDVIARRNEDRLKITTSDLLGAIRLHSQALDYPRDD